LIKKIPLEQFDATIIFYNQGRKYNYKKPETLFNPENAVFCCPDNYDLNNREGEGIIRATFMANYDLWKELPRERYLEEKERVYEESLALTRKLIPSFNQEIYFKDVFSPTTVERYTWHEKRNCLR
jgi:hypothetical protein